MEMTRFVKRTWLSAIFLVVFSLSQGADSELWVKPVGPTRLDVPPGSNVTLAVTFSDVTQPLIKWLMGTFPVVTYIIDSTTQPDIASNVSMVVNVDPRGCLTFHNISLLYTSTYTVKVAKSGVGEDSVTFTLNVFELPSDDPVCSVKAVNSVDVQYHCEWLGGIPPVQLLFPALSNSSGAGDFSLTVSAASHDLNWKTITCATEHPVRREICNITTRSPEEFVPTLRTVVEGDGKVVAAISCISEATPPAVVSWYRGSEELSSGVEHAISTDTTVLLLRDYNASDFLLSSYTCVAHNPLGSSRQEIQLRGFDVQMKGPELKGQKRNSDEYLTVQQEPDSARSADVFPLQPKSADKFREIPVALMTAGEPTEAHQIGPAGKGLSGPAIAGIAAGIPCSILFLILLVLLIYFVGYHRKIGQQARYPVQRAVERVIVTQIDHPHHLPEGKIKSLFVQTPSEKSLALPGFVPPPPRPRQTQTRAATIV